MKLPMEYPGVGVDVYIRKNGKVLLGLRKSSYGAGEWCAPGGKMELKESPEEAVVREAEEECGVGFKNLRFINITNDIHDIGTHFLTVNFVADWDRGEPQLKEPDKFEKWEWFSWDNLPEPLFLSTRNFIHTGYNPLNI